MALFLKIGISIPPILYLKYDLANNGSVINPLIGTNKNVIKSLPLSETDVISISFVLNQYTKEVNIYIIAVPAAINIIFSFFPNSPKQ